MMTSRFKKSKGWAELLARLLILEKPYIDRVKETDVKYTRPTFEGKLKAAQLMESMIADHENRIVEMDRHEMTALILEKEGVQLSIHTVADIAKAANIILARSKMARYTAKELNDAIKALEERVASLEAKAEPPFI